VRATEVTGPHRVPIEAAGPSRAIGAASRASYRSHRTPPRANRGRGTLARYRSREPCELQKQPGPTACQ
jgi:hypothetical protein